MRKWLKYTWEWVIKILQNKRTWRTFYIVIILASLGFIAYAGYKNWNELKAQKWEINYKFLILTILFFPLGMLPTVAAWHKLLEALGVRKPFGTNLRIYALSSLPRHIPGLVWYVSSRTVMYQEEGVAGGVVLAATAIEVMLLAVTGFFSSTLLLLSGGAVVDRFPFLRFIIPIALFLGVSLFFITPIYDRFSPKLMRRFNLDKVPRLYRGSLISCLLWLFVGWIGGGFLLFLMTRGFTSLSWSAFPIMIGAWGMASGIGLTIGIGISGMGLREVTLGALLSLIIPPLIAVVVAIAFRLAITVGEFIWVFLFAWITKSAPQKPAGRTGKMS